MDVQLKKGIIELLVLASIKYQDSYGYKIIQDIASIADISESTMYPILRRLEDSGFVKTYQKEYSSRIRKYYQITKAGLKRLEESEKEFSKLRQIYDYILR